MVLVVVIIVSSSVIVSLNSLAQKNRAFLENLRFVLNQETKWDHSILNAVPDNKMGMTAGSL